MNLHWRCHGQAMAEFVVMTAGCLLLLFVLVLIAYSLGWIQPTGLPVQR